MIDGITSRPFSAATLPPLKVDPTSGVKNKIIEMSRSLYTRPRAEVEADILKWSGMLQSGDGDAKYKADCSNCKKITMVPFEPQEGRPVYCKDCMFKIKSGELKPESGFVASRSSRQEEKVSTSPLAALGIEFAVAGQPLFNNHNNHNNYKNHHNQNNNTGENHKNNFSKQEKRNSGPSPLLKGLLEKIGVNGKGSEKVEVVEVKKELVATMPLSALKHDKPKEVKKENHVYVKEASEEKKTSLKDLLARTVNHNQNKKEEESHKPEIHVSEEVKPEPKIEQKVEESKPEPAKEEVKINPPIIPISHEEAIPKQNTEEDVLNNKNSNHSWQQPKAKKEVPEDVLRKILE